MKNVLCSLGLIFFAALLNAQTESQVINFKMNSSADLYITDDQSDNNLLNLRVQPGIDLAYKAGEVSFTGELSADLNVLNNLTMPWSWKTRRIQVYRAWLGVQYKNHAVRAGLQNLKFGSGDLIRPLQWFDQESSMDPLLQSIGSTGICDVVSLKNKVNLTIWAMNKSDVLRYINYTKVYRATKPDLGFRLEQKEGKNSLAFNFNYRSEISPYLSGSGYIQNSVHLKQIGLDGTYDLGPLVWFETSTSVLNKINDAVSMISCGTDLSGRSKGKPTLVAEHLFILNHSAPFFDGIHFSSLKMECPLNQLKFTAICQYDWETEDLLKGAYITLDVNNIAFQFSGYSMPDKPTYLYSSVFSNLLPGTGFTGSVILKFK